MIKFKMLLASLLVAGVSAQTTFAQVASEKKKSGYPYAFVGVQGGGQVTFGNYDATKLITPNWGCEHWWNVYTRSRCSLARKRN